jgi:putative flippase GtrA
MALDHDPCGLRRAVPAPAPHDPWLRRLAAKLPRPFRFLMVGGTGLVFDIALFTILFLCGVHTLIAGFLALVAATVLTWRLNRAFTFDRSGRSQGEEAFRYAIVTAVAQGTSYAVFVGLVLTVLAPLPQAAIIAGAAVGAIISYNGHRLFAFAPSKAVAQPAKPASRPSELVRA